MFCRTRLLYVPAFRVVANFIPSNGALTAETADWSRLALTVEPTITPQRPSPGLAHECVHAQTVEQVLRVSANCAQFYPALEGAAVAVGSAAVQTWAVGLVPAAQVGHKI